MKSEFGHCTVTADTVTSESAAYRAADRGSRTTRQTCAPPPAHADTHARTRAHTQTHTLWSTRLARARTANTDRTKAHKQTHLVALL